MPNTNKKPTRTQRRARKSKSYAEQFANWLGNQAEAEAEANGECTEPELYEQNATEY